MMRLTPIAIAVALAGCATTPEVVTVKVPVPCKAPKVERPAMEFDQLPADAGLDASVNALLIEREQREAYELKLEAAVKACQ